MSEAQKIRVRFAPSPTGKLHLGGARTAIYNWAFARAQGGSFILRIEDTDPTRSTEENTQIILRAMRWLGLDWDEGPDVGGDFGPYFQTERTELYREALEKLVANGRAYPCFCSVEKLAADKEAAIARKDSFIGYQGTCRDLDPKEAKARIAAGEPHTWRLRVPHDRGDVLVHDLIHGDVVFNARELDDFVIVRSDGTPTYNFAVVVDDANMQISHVIRGDDHLSNTPKQVLIYEALDYEVPKFAHLSMILGPDGKKLSKRHGATSVEEFRDEGYLSDVMVNQLSLLGWALDGETTIMSRETIQKNFSLDHVSKNPSTFEPAKLSWMQQQYLQAMDDASFAREFLIPALVDTGLEDEDALAHDEAWYELLSSVLKPRVVLFNDVYEKAAFLYEDHFVMDEKSVQKNLAKEGALSSLEATERALEAVSEWQAEAIDAALAPLPDELELGKRPFFGAVRVAVCGNQVSPPLGESLELMGKERALVRIAAAKELCSAS